MPDMKNFMDFDNAEEIFSEVGQKFERLNGALVFRGNTTFANLPAVLTESMAGYTYNVTDNFTTDARFVEGAGKKFKAGTNVDIADLSTYDAVTPEAGDNPSTEGWYELVNGKYVLSADTEVDDQKTYYAKTVTIMYEISGAFVNVEEIENEIQAVSDMITDEEFDSTQAYAVDAVVKHEGKLYIFTSAHTANTDWDVTEVQETTVKELIDNAQPSSFTTAQVNSILTLLN